MFEAVPVPHGNTTAVDVSGGGVCTNKALLESLKVIVNESEQGIRHLGDIPAYAATSCQQIASLRSEATSGHYWIQESLAPPVFTVQWRECLVERECGCK